MNPHSDPSETGGQPHAGETEVQAAWRRVYRSLLVRGSLLVLAILVLGGGAGWLFVGREGLYGGLVGGGIAAVFLLVSFVVVYLGRNLSMQMLAGALGIGFLFKAFLFMILISRLAGAPWLHGTTAFLTIVAAVIATSLLDVLTVARARIPYADPEAR
ncbi:hypothetical protein [Brevibacterium salitolerans]|uniref:ATP synthase protein I n=1 Tax=Brevibacterium salitolerans TaxID=1403566 RepID=A0ABP5HWT1_9MICO